MGEEGKAATPKAQQGGTSLLAKNTKPNERSRTKLLAVRAERRLEGTRHNPLSLLAARGGETRNWGLVLDGWKRTGPVTLYSGQAEAKEVTVSHKVAGFNGVCA